MAYMQLLRDCSNYGTYLVSLLQFGNHFLVTLIRIKHFLLRGIEEDLRYKTIDMLEFGYTKKISPFKMLTINFLSSGPSPAGIFILIKKLI